MQHLRLPCLTTQKTLRLVIKKIHYFCKDFCCMNKKMVTGQHNPHFEFVISYSKAKSNPDNALQILPFTAA